MHVPERMRRILENLRRWIPNPFAGSILAEDEGFPFFGNPLVRALALSSLLVVILSFLAVAIFIVRGGSETIILHYNVYFGVDIVGAPWQAFFIPVAAMLFFSANLVLARRFYLARERVASHMLLFTSFFSALSGAIATGALSFINS